MNIIWFTVVVGLLVLLQMQFFRSTGLWKVTYRRFFGSHAVFEGEKTSMVEVIENRKPLFVPWIRVESRISPYLRFKAMDNLNINHDQYHRSLFFLRPYLRITRTHEITCAHRGYYVLKLASITSGDLFGMTSPVKDYIGDSELYVYPRILSADEVPLPALKFQGDVTMRRWIMPDPILVNGIREYRPGDPQKDIHWGATARTGTLHVKVHDYTVSPRILVLLNAQITEILWGNMSPEQQDIIEEGVRIAAFFADWAISNGIDVGVYSNGKLIDSDEMLRIEPSCSAAHLERILVSLAKFQIISELNFHTMLDHLYDEGINGQDIAVVSTYWSDLLEEKAELLRSLGNTVTHIPFGTGAAGEADKALGDKMEATA